MILQLLAIMPAHATGRWGGPDSSFWAFAFSPASKSKIRKSENQKWSLGNYFRDATQLRYKSQKGNWRTLSLKDMRWSECPWRGNFRDKSQKCFGPGLSYFPNFPWQLRSGGPKVEDRWGRPSNGWGCFEIDRLGLVAPEFISVLTSVFHPV